MRVEVRWDSFNRSPGDFDATNPARVFALASAHPKMRLMVLFNHAPQFAIDEPGRFADHAAAAASWLIRRYGKQIAAVEVFNEPNLPGTPKFSLDGQVTRLGKSTPCALS